MTRRQGLTGRVRVRLQRRWFRRPLLVPQVEVLTRWSGTEGERSSRSWRDMRTEDLVGAITVELGR